MNRKITVMKTCMVALAVCINVAGGQIALILHLPIYLDSVGTILTGVLFGPFYGMVPNLLSGIVMGMTTDIYSLYFAPVGMVTGFMAGIAARLMRKGIGERWTALWLPALFVTVPGTIASSFICAGLFGGITSSGSTILVQLLSHAGLGMTASVFAVQIMTDYLDRFISLYLVGALVRIMPPDVRQACAGDLEGRRS